MVIGQIDAREWSQKYFFRFTWNVWPLTTSCWGGGFFTVAGDFLSSAIEPLLSVSISSEDMSDDDVEDVEFLKMTLC